MTFISYAQNFEDVMLWRALKGVGAGYYIDVGAAHPDIDSVTRAFYDHGWSGLNIEPVPGSARLLQASRPRDTTLQVALGAMAGTTSFFVVDGAGSSYPGLSTALAPVGDSHRANFSVQEINVSVNTLSAVCERHVRGPIHFLKIDVEGFERAVLEGADFSRFRPWIVLLEATAPLSTEPNYAEWEPILLAADYRFAWSDGLNRFYVAAEKCADLLPAFSAPPNVFDNFIRPADIEIARLLSRSEAMCRDFLARASSAEERERAIILRMGREAVSHAELERLYRERTADRHHLAGHVHIVNAQALDLIDQVANLTKNIDAIRRSTSWKITAPLRLVIARLRGTSRRAEPSSAASSSRSMVAPELPASVAGLLPSDRRYERPRRAVHQFHADSSAGDAVTTSMLLVRDLLRSSGYRSQIYVANRDRSLADELSLLEELPSTDDYVLLIHHSMGQEPLDRILALPAPKVLIYHNVTPPSYIGTPSLREAARVGREQLGRMRTQVAAALADSDFNAVELRGLGFDPVRTCTLLFDPAKLAGPVPKPEPGAPFTVLFVGRVVESKGQLELIEAFAGFVASYGDARLVLVGRYSETDHLYRETLDAAIRRNGIEKKVIITGPVSDDERDRWYAAADLYVSLSSHEGFGVPLVEAMARGLPVLARPVGAVPDTLAGIGELLDDASPTAVAGRMLALARDPARRVAMSKAGLNGLSRFAPSRHLPRLLEAVVRAGADFVPEPVVFPAGLRFAVAGHVNGTYSLAAVNLRLIEVLGNAYPGRVRLLPVEGEAIETLDRINRTIGADVERFVIPAPETGPEVVISHHYPIYVPPNGGDLLLALMFWEESLLPPEAVARLARFRGVLAPSRLVAKVLVDSGVDLPIHPYRHVPNIQPFLAIEPRQREGRTIFLHVSSCFPRKGVDVLLAAFALAFRASDAVELVIKGHPNPHNDVEEQIARLRATDPDAPAIRYIDADLGEADLLALYQSADAMVLPSRGEGLNLPAIEALAAGLPLIVTGWGGHLDFCGPDEARLLEWRFAPARGHVSTDTSVWAEPEVGDLVEALLEMVRDPDTARTRARRGRARIAAAFDPAETVAAVTAFATRLLVASPPAPVHVAWVSPFGVRCGVAEYSRHLLSNLEVGSVTVVADDRERLPDYTDLPGINVRRAWRIDDAVALEQISAGLAREDASVVVVQHQPGLLHWDTLAALLRRATGARGLPMVAVLHSTRHLATIGESERLNVIDALRHAARVLVHTLDDLNRLRRWGVVENVALVPHGIGTIRQARPCRALAKADAVLIGCYGFLLPGKGIPQLIEAVALLRRDRPATRLRLVNARYPWAASDVEFERCRGAIVSAGLGDVVEMHTDFLTDGRSLDLLAECDLIVMPYQYSDEAASGALHSALAAGVPIAVTPLPLFDDAAGAVLKLPGFGPGEIAGGIEAFLDDQAIRERSVAAANTWANSRSWAAVGKRLSGIVRQLSSSMASPPTRSEHHKVEMHESKAERLEIGA